MTQFPVAEVYEVVLPVALMPRPDVGQIGFSTKEKSFSFLMPRRDFEKLGRKIARLLAETPPPVPTRGAKPPSSGK